jgi:8-oxo-dGTP pyrophosphatase MutT (NUDIX family)
MNFDPKNFFIGLIDFFSIILPGAILTYLLKDDGWGWVFRGERSLPDGTEGWMVFVLASYLLGHFIFLLSAWLDEWYDHTRKATLNHQIKQLAWHGKLLPQWYRAMIWLVFKREQDIAVDRAGRIKRHYLNKLGGSTAVNTFQWSKARLAIEHPESLATVQRFEADSKFFRGLVIVLLLLIIWWAVHGRCGITLACMGLLLMALWRYMEQRHKATNQAYWSVITLEAKDGAFVAEAKERKPNEPTHAGGVVYYREGGDVKFLVVQASNTPNEWVLPKGKIELDERMRETAVREVLEETGVWARIIDWPLKDRSTDEGVHLKDVPMNVDDKDILVRFYMMEAMEQGASEDRWRASQWLTHSEAIKTATYKNAQELIAQVAAAIPQDKKNN